MKIQMSTEHAIRIVRYLHLKKEGVHSAQEISVVLGVSYPFFVKIAGMLRRAGILSAMQGRHGGYQLSKSASEISLYDIVLAVEGELKLIDRRTRDADGACEVRSYFRQMQKIAIANLSEQNVAEL